MASSIGRKQDDAASPSIKDLIQGAPGSLLDALVVLAIGLSVGLYFGFSIDARLWAVETLGYGWIPLGFWIAVSLVTLRYNRHVIFVHWRRWIISAALVAISIGILSTIFPDDGALEDVSMGGKWGAYLGGTPLTLAAAKMGGIVLVIPPSSAAKTGRFRIFALLSVCTVGYPDSGALFLHRHPGVS